MLKYCPDCKEFVKATVYNDEVNPVVWVCSECAQVCENCDIETGAFDPDLD